ncbi:MAG TPA: HNH endonuclease signature motif containing protein [Kofleriaceae bacterium]|nr:HNH endonuclease signature motif containing protein [Kofleriaceae bacterium]
MKLEVCLEALSDDILIARLVDLLGRSRGVEAELVAHLAEVDARRLYRREACPSMHAYATERLHLSDAEAYLRITVARLSRRFPVVLDMLADGRHHLSGIARLAPHLRDEDGEALLARAALLSKREIEHLIAEIAPQADAPALIRKLPAAPRSTAQPLISGPCLTSAAGSDAVGDALHEAGRDAGGDVGGQGAVAPGGSAGDDAGCESTRRPLQGPAPVAPAPSGRPVLTPIAPLRYKVQFTAGAELHDKLVRAQALLRRHIPDGDLAAVVERAMTLLLRELERGKFAAAASPRKTAAEVDPTPRSRHIPDPIRREVWERDGGQCTFHDRNGRRCPARERLEFHHVAPFGRGGDHSAANVRLVCTIHNAYQAELDYGAAFMAAHRRRGREDGGRASEGGGREAGWLVGGAARRAGSGAARRGWLGTPRRSALGTPLWTTGVQACMAVGAPVDAQRSQRL